MSVEGADKLDKKLKKIGAADMRGAIENAIQTVRADAVRNCPADTGELRQKIYAEVEGQRLETVGTCWTNVEYAPYVEFGTGPKGQADHTGISPDVAVAYSQSPWWIHESQIDARVAAKYHWYSIETPDGKFYLCTGQAAQPFMYPALANNRDKILKGIKADFIAEFSK